MTTRKVGNSLNLSFLGTDLVEALSVEQLKRAAIIAADNSTGIYDCIELLDILGIDLQGIWNG